MPVPYAVAIGVVGQQLEGVVANGLQQAEAVGLAHQQAGSDQHGQVLPTDAHGLGGVGLEPAGEHAEPAQGCGRVRRQEVGAPPDGRAQRPLTTRPLRGPVGRQVEPRGEVVRHLVEGHLAHSCRRELDGERQPVEPGADPLDRRDAASVEAMVGRGRSRGEERHRVVHVQRAELPDVLAVHPQRNPAGHHHLHAVARSEQARHQVGGGLDLLEVVEHEEEAPAGDVVDQGRHRVLAHDVDPEALRDGRGDQPDVVEVRELDEPHAVGAGAGHLVGQVQRQAGLADAAGPRQRQQSGAVGQQPDQLVPVGTAADQGGRRSR